MRVRLHYGLVAVVAILALLTALVAPTPHDHLGKPGSVCHACNAAQPVALTAALLSIEPVLPLVDVVVSSEQRHANGWYALHRIPRAPPA